MTKNQEIAQEILNQLGGQSKLNAMLGLKDVFAIENGVSFKIKVKGAKANYVKIILVNDLYNLEFGKLRGNNYDIVETFEGASNDMLKNLLRKTTGCVLAI